MPAGSQERIYKVVLNPQGYYSLWPSDEENAHGWKDAGKSGTEAECLNYIEEAWTLMRPSKEAVSAK